MHFLTSIGVILAVTGILLIVILKSPLKISDKLLIAILSCFVLKFLLDEWQLLTGSQVFSVFAAMFGMSTIATCGWYIKYLTDESEGFGWRQLLIYSPLVLLFLLTLAVLPWHLAAMYQTPAVRYVLLLMIALIIYYFYFCIRMLQKHKQLIRQNYSGVSGSITINWMVIIISLQIAEFLLKGVLSNVFGDTNNALQVITNEYCFIIETFLLVVLGIWQKSIPVFIPPAEKAGQTPLQPGDLKRYLLRIEKFMTEEKPYLDPELTIEKLSDLTRIRKLSLSQTLNKGLNKNFFTFIKEYRIKHVEDELKNKTSEKRTIMDIAYGSGFNSKTGFNRAFKEVTGKTPTEYLGEG